MKELKDVIAAPAVMAINNGAIPMESIGYLLDQQAEAIKKWMGKADWIWDEGLQCHIPSCTYPSFGPDKYWDRCGNGPLTTPEQIQSGNCGEH